jgi:prephenate dehydrogenase
MERIKKISILGVGLMGGSFALSLKKIFPQIEIIGYARSRKTFQRLSQLNVVDKVELDLKQCVCDSDLIVLAAPIYAITDYLKQIGPYLKKEAIVIDLGSTKEQIGEAAKKYLAKNVDFVGCHPLSGSDKSGAEFSSPKLYQGSLCIVTADANKKATQIIKNLWQKLGAKVIFMDALSHDKILSSVSHVMHLVSFSLTDFVPRNYLKFAQASFKDLTRISNSPANVWADIFISNKKNIIKDASKVIEILKRFQSLIKKNKKEEIISLIEKINRKQKLSRCQRTTGYARG